MRNIALIIVLAVWAPCGLGEPFLPTDDSLVLERLPFAAFDAQAAELQGLRERWSEAPDDLGRALTYARRLIEIGRRYDDPRYYGYAQAALAPWWELNNPPAQILVLRATLEQNRHEFDAALTDLTGALKSDPRNAQAWLTRATILQVQGRFDGARLNCRPLLKLGHVVLSAICDASIDALTGNSRAAARRLSALLALNHEPEVQLWVLAQLAEIAARLGENGEAERYFTLALERRPDDAYLLASYADFLLDGGEAAQVADLLAGFERVDRLLLRLAFAEKQLGASTLSARIDELTRRFAAANARSPDAALHAGEEARFRLHLLGDKKQALVLAQQNWASQREPRDIRILLEAALAAGSGLAAEPALRFLEQTRLEDNQLERLSSAVRELAR